MVRWTTLAEVAQGLGLGAYLLLGEGEEASGGRLRPANLAAALEAVIGASLLDQGVGPARTLVLRLLEERLQQLGEDGAQTDAKSALQELAQRRGLPMPEYTVVRSEDPDQAPIYTARVSLGGGPMGEGSGRRKVEAEKAAAAQALAQLSG